MVQVKYIPMGIIKSPPNCYIIITVVCKVSLSVTMLLKMLTKSYANDANCNLI